MPAPITDINRESVLAFIAAARKEQGLSVDALERRAGVPEDTIRDFQRGKAHLIRADKLKKILNALGYDLSVTRLALAAVAAACLFNVTSTQAAFPRIAGYHQADPRHAKPGREDVNGQR